MDGVVFHQGDQLELVQVDVHVVDNIFRIHGSVQYLGKRNSFRIEGGCEEKDQGDDDISKQAVEGGFSCVSDNEQQGNDQENDRFGEEAKMMPAAIFFWALRSAPEQKAN